MLYRLPNSDFLEAMRKTAGLKCQRPVYIRCNSRPQSQWLYA